MNIRKNIKKKGGKNMDRMYRVAISEKDNNCQCWDDQPDDTDYCCLCQYTYYSLTDVGPDYADETVGYYDTEDEAKEIDEGLIAWPPKFENE